MQKDFNVKRQRCLTGLILPLIAAAIVLIPPAAAQIAQSEPADSAQQTGPSSQSGDQGGNAASSEAISPLPAREGSSAQAADTENEELPTQDKASDSSKPAPEPIIAEQPSPPPSPAHDPKDVLLKIATWGGAYGQSQERAIFKPYAERSGYKLETVIYDGDYGRLAEQGDTPQWSLVDLNGEAMVRACEENRLERLDFTILEPAPDGTPLSEDFLPGAIHPCGIASVAWSAVIVYDTGMPSKPASLKDFFDLAAYPGKRLLPKQPRYSLELALMADGVAPGDVYATLKTAEGQDRAFNKLSSVKDDIVWWDKPSEVFGRIADKQAIMGLAFNGRAFMAKVASQQPIDILWDGQIYSFDYWSIPRGTAFAQPARDFIRFATSTIVLSDQARWIPYGPARRSALKFVNKHAHLDLDMKPLLPTHEPNLASALLFDGAFWAAEQEKLQDRFADWINGRQLPKQRAAELSQ